MVEKQIQGAEQMAQQSRAALAEDVGAISSSHMAAHNQLPKV